MADLSQNMQAFLSTIGYSEGTTICPQTQNNGYDILVGGKRFDSYVDHPRKVVNIGNGLYSTAAGRYQIKASIYDAYKKQLGLPDFSPEAQDAIALQLIHECKATDDIENGNFMDAITKCKSRWASLPGAGYGQHENSYAALRIYYIAAGGTTV